MPSRNISAPPKMPSSGAANRSVPSFNVGITLWIDGVPGSAVRVKVPAPSASAPQSNRLGMSASFINRRPSGYIAKITTNTTTPP